MRIAEGDEGLSEQFPALFLIWAHSRQDADSGWSDQPWFPFLL